MADEDEDTGSSTSGEAIDTGNYVEEEEIVGRSTEYVEHLTRSLQHANRLMREEEEKLIQQIEDYESKTDCNTLALFNRTEQATHVLATVIEVLDLDPQEDEGSEEDEGTRKYAIVRIAEYPEKYFSRVPNYIDELKVGDLVSVKSDNYVILEKHPPVHDCDPTLSAMVVNDKPTDRFKDIAGLDTQIEELREAIILPLTQAESFKRVGVCPPKGVLLYGPPGTGKTLLARACAAETDATFVRLAGPQLVQSHMGVGAKLIRDGFKFAKENAPCIIFIDEIDAIGAKRLNSEANGNTEIERTMIELLHQLDGFSSSDQIKVVAATNRVGSLDPALMRSGRLDRKIELPHPYEGARFGILKIHSCKMTLDPSVNLEEVGRSAEDFSGAQLKAVCVEAGMSAYRRQADEVSQEDFIRGIAEVQGRKKFTSIYHA